MRGDDPNATHMFSYISPEQRVPADHPLRAIRQMTDTALKAMSPRFATLYSDIGRPSVPPEQLLRALLLQILYSIRSERQLMEQLDYNLLFRWFVGLNMDDRVWSATTFSKNRDRLLAGDIAQAFFAEVRGDCHLLRSARAELRELVPCELRTRPTGRVQRPWGSRWVSSGTRRLQSPQAHQFVGRRCEGEEPVDAIQIQHPANAVLGWPHVAARFARLRILPKLRPRPTVHPAAAMAAHQGNRFGVHEGHLEDPLPDIPRAGLGHCNFP
jgi:transposase